MANNPRELFQQTEGLMPWNLHVGAGSAGPNVVLDIGMYTRPSILTANEIQGPVLTEMSRDGMIMLVLKNSELKVVRFR